MQENEISLEVKNIVKTYPGVKALDGVSMAFRKGEVHAIMGENGAGKSTLIKTIAGSVTPDSGEIYVDGKRVQKHKMQAEIDDTDFTRYTYTIEKAFKVKEGQYIEVYFKAEDENGLNYTYLVDRSHVTNGDVETAGSVIEAADSVQEGRLKVE